MTSESSPLWDFGPVYNLFDTFDRSRLLNDESLDHSAIPVPPVPGSHIDTNPKKPSNLGDFDNVFSYLGQTVDKQLSEDEPTGLSSAADSCQSTPSPPISDDVITRYEDLTKEVRWTDQLKGTGSAERSGSEPGPPGGHLHSARLLRRRKTILNASADEAATHGVAPLVSAWASRPKSEGVLWVPPPTPSIHIDPLVIQPIHPLTAEEKKAKLLRKLKARYHVASDSLRSKDQNGIHIFVDCSNVMIGFYNALKISRGYHIRAFAKNAPISWHSLALILERGRSVARRIIVGSNGSLSDGRPLKLPSYMLEAERCGYELNILERVLKHKDPTPLKRNPKGTGNGYATISGQSSGSEGTFPGAKVVAEQGVDEILQMKLLESLVDTRKPSTIVLASGDAAEAEYSGGFMKSVLRALNRGWKVELVAWSTGLSHEYSSREFLQRWKGRFEVILLNDFSEELLAL